jgi:glutamine synthetase
MSTSTPGRLTRKDLLSQIESGDIDTVILAITDMQGRLQGKRVDARFFADDLADGVVEGCSYLLASDVDINTVDGFALTSWERGYGDLAFKAGFHHGSPRAVARQVGHHLLRRRDREGVPVAVAAPDPLAQRSRLAERGWTGSPAPNSSSSSLRTPTKKPGTPAIAISRP